MKNIPVIIKTTFAAGLWLYCGCGLTPLAGGTSTAENGRILGRTVDQFGEPAPRTEVRLLPADFNPVAGTAPIPADTTDEYGAYDFTGVGPGRYNVQSVRIDNRTRALTCGIFVAHDTVVVTSDTLAPPGALSIVLPDPGADGNDHVYIPGTLCMANVRNGVASIDSIPAGFVPVVKYASTADPAKDHVIKTNFTVASGGTTVIADCSAWRYSAKLFLNTTAGGANVSGSVSGFPVLVRLSAATFDFSRAAAGGRDLRFSKSDDTPLWSEVESWDSANALAAVWVRVDTVYGNNASQYIVMRWGAAAAQSVSSGSAVFDTGAGFQGVWHLAETQATVTHDATINHYDGAKIGQTLPAATSGAIGTAQEFDGASGGITLQNTAHSKLGFYGDGYYTFSAWVYADTLDSTFYPIVAKGNYQNALQLKEFNVWEFFIYKDTTWKCVWSPATARAWKHITGVRNFDRQYLYVDGVLASDSIITVPKTLVPVPDDTTRDVTIGCISDPSRFFKGKIDEVRIENRARTPEWIKLSYMNQKAQDRLVVFK